jgi:DNA-binding phage protein
MAGSKALSPNGNPSFETVHVESAERLLSETCFA